ncbi:MAG: hypothetical protein F6K48_14410 [Okeania sp. SIO3H1]|nr:hypothetical protein [Okeania sp. SIO3H1]
MFLVLFSFCYRTPDRIFINLARRQETAILETGDNPPLAPPPPNPPLTPPRRGGEEEKGKIWGEIIHKIQHTNTKIFGSY